MVRDPEVSCVSPKTQGTKSEVPLLRKRLQKKVQGEAGISLSMANIHDRIYQTIGNKGGGSFTVLGVGGVFGGGKVGCWDRYA